ncbi:Lead, cadmium, zinc and mercury transporting ATPase [Klebsiella pneumoniae]|uniref:Lead, cadmium, zinc and mercury transporting ATPase n=1 Tax=Klebsiella pneumoniae TaxID=573 RepID=A0A2X3GBN8_KLEPN|nr:Lead, cadmium, zinc and mercury transporting ATPase [Klebsiella pneumoniae]
MGSGTDVALETADAALTHNRLTGLAQMISLARATHANIRQNIAIALGLKGIFLVTTPARPDRSVAGGAGGYRPPPCW